MNSYPNSNSKILLQNKIANNIIENILDYDDIYDGIKEENKKLKEN